MKKVLIAFVFIVANYTGDAFALQADCNADGPLIVGKRIFSKGGFDSVALPDTPKDNDKIGIAVMSSGQIVVGEGVSAVREQRRFQLRFLRGDHQDVVLTHIVASNFFAFDASGRTIALVAQAKPEHGPVTLYVSKNGGKTFAKMDLPHDRKTYGRIHSSVRVHCDESVSVLLWREVDNCESKEINRVDLFRLIGAKMTRTSLAFREAKREPEATFGPIGVIYGDGIYQLGKRQVAEISFPKTFSTDKWDVSIVSNDINAAAVTYSDNETGVRSLIFKLGKKGSVAKFPFTMLSVELLDFKTRLWGFIGDGKIVRIDATDAKCFREFDGAPISCDAG